MTRLPLAVAPPAEQDVRTTADEYDARCPRLGDRFADQVAHTIERIAWHPQAFQPLSAGSAGRSSRASRTPLPNVSSPTASTWWRA